MQLHESRVTLRDVVAAVSGLTQDEEEAAAVINHMLSSERIAFANRPRRGELEYWLA
ncbi:MAG TPA: hypothetical protein VME21_09205 [Steroidobacteraceae bacterium]|nr:hypothetical protein [Steroidobacteraceae bacterium]